MKILEDIFLVGADEHRQPLFENLHPIPNGVSYNSYLLLDEKTVLFDTVDWSVCQVFLEKLTATLGDRELDYLVVNHMEPDHCACIDEVLLRYPSAKIITNAKAYAYMIQFGFDVSGRVEFVLDNETRCFGKHTIKFIFAPLVHWPEVMVSFDETTGVLFSADAFGTFGALNGKIFADEYTEDLIPEYRRYYTNIVGKYGQPVQNLLKKVSLLDVKMICSLHGPIIRKDFAKYIEKYDLWSSYTPEENGVLIVYSSMYGNTEKVAKLVAKNLNDAGVNSVEVFDVSSTDMSLLVANSFKYSHIIVASVTYNSDVFPLIHNYLADIKALNLQNRTIGIIQNGTWAITAGKIIRTHFESMKNMTILDNMITIKSAMNEQNYAEIQIFSNEISETLNK